VSKTGDTAGAELSVEVVSAEFAASAGVNEAAMAIAKRVFLLIFTILYKGEDKYWCND